MSLSWKEVSTVEGLALTGQADAKRGSVITAKGFSGVKRYSFRRNSSGHARVRWGRLAGAKACYEGDKLLSVIFNVDAS